MAVKIVCDGDLVLLEPQDVVTFGDLDPVTYCRACAATWTATQAAIDAARVTAITTFTAARDAALTLARTALQKLPDDPGPGGR